MIGTNLVGMQVEYGVDEILASSGLSLEQLSKLVILFLSHPVTSTSKDTDIHFLRISDLEPLALGPHWRWVTFPTISRHRRGSRVYKALYARVAG